MKGKELYLRESETLELVRIPRKLGSEAVKRLGVLSTCDGKWTQEYKSWKQLARDFGGKLLKARVDRFSGYKAYHAIWIAKVRYSAAVIGLSRNQLRTIQQTVINPCLSVAGFCRTIPRAVVYGTSQYGGMDWDHIYTLYVFEKLKFIIGSIRLQDKVGQMLLIQLSWLQLFAGTSVMVLQSSTFLHYLPTGWIQNLHMLLIENDIKVEIRNIWKPTKQREHDRILMDIVHHMIPKWAWAGINRCRLFLGATTMADIVSFDGLSVPDDVKLVRKPIRETKLQFPLQQRPSKEDIRQWQYLIDSMAANGKLFVPLGSWIRTPDQVFKYMQEATSRVVYKRLSTGWDVYGTKGTRSRYYIKIPLKVTTIPYGCVPVRVIDASRYLIVLQNEQFRNRPLGSLRNNYSIYENQVMGKFSVDRQQMNRLKSIWNKDHIKLVGATDGGLKIMIGTSSYALFFPNEFPPIIQGCAGEYQPKRTASSTRQELLGQLGLEYWLRRLGIKLGIPNRQVTVTLITDSQSSIDIIANAHRMTGIKDTLQPDMDIGLEVAHQYKLTNWVIRQVIKVESHIEEEKAPNKFYWECNELVDRMATNARSLFSIESLKLTRIGVLPGTWAGCIIQKSLVNSDLYRNLKEHIHGTELRKFLMTKYGWTEKTFKLVDWEEHDRQLKAFSIQQRVTLVKYIHGWLATQRRRFREGSSVTAQCPLCGEEETRGHLFCCQYQQMKDIRQGLWAKLITDISHDTDQGFRQIFIAGLATALGAIQPTEATKADWPTNLREAYQNQELVGWDQVFFGRICHQWESLSGLSQLSTSALGTHRWVGKTIKNCWAFGLELWKTRNGFIHGTDGTISILEKARVNDLIRRLFQHRFAMKGSQELGLFQGGEEALLKMGHSTQLAWVERIRYLYPSNYSEIVGNAISSRGNFNIR